MNLLEKITLVALNVALIASTALYGVWEDKVMLFAPLLVLIYLVLALWAIAACRSRGVGPPTHKGLYPGGEYLSKKTLSRSLASSLPYSQTPPDAPGGAAGDQKLAVSAEQQEDREQRPDSVRQASALTFHILHSTTYGGLRPPPGGIMLLLFCLYSAILIPFSVIPYEAKISTLRFGCYLATYWAVSSICSRFPRRRAVWLTVFSALVLVALYSLVQHKLNPEMLFGHLRYTNYGERLGGTYICPNHIAHLFQMWTPLCLVFLFIPQFGWFWRICFGYALPLFVLLIYQTQSRAGLLGLIAGVATTGLLLMLRKSRRAFYFALLVVPLLGAGALGGLWAGSSMFRERMQPVVKFVDHQFSKTDIDDEFKDFRPQTWLDSLGMIKERPLFGVGPGNYGQTFPEYRQRVIANRMETVHPHNEYIELLAEYGLIGALLVVGVLVSVLVPLIRLIKTSKRLIHVLPAVALLAALAGTAVHGFFDFEIRVFSNALMLSLLAGCAVAPIVRQRSEVRSQKSARSERR